jgi:hypothetical protein
VILPQLDHGGFLCVSHVGGDFGPVEQHRLTIPHDPRIVTANTSPVVIANVRTKSPPARVPSSTTNA